MKMIGVLGGNGPHAAMDFERQIPVESRKLIPPNGKAGYPRLVVWYHRNPPFVMDEHNIPKLPLTIDPDVDGVILGSTEIAFHYGEGTDATDLINPAQILVEAAVREALR